MALTIREATEADVEALVTLGALFHAQHPLGDLAAYDAPSVSAFLGALRESPTAAVFVADVEGRMLGFLAAMVVPLYFNVAVKVVCEVCWYVEPSARGAHVGGALYTACITWAHGLGATAAKFGAPVASPTTIALLEDKGFVPYEFLCLRTL